MKLINLFIKLFEHFRIVANLEYAYESYAKYVYRYILSDLYLSMHNEVEDVLASVYASVCLYFCVYVRVSVRGSHTAAPSSSGSTRSQHVHAPYYTSYSL